MYAKFGPKCCQQATASAAGPPSNLFNLPAGAGVHMAGKRSNRTTISLPGSITTSRPKHERQQNGDGLMRHVTKTATATAGEKRGGTW